MHQFVRNLWINRWTILFCVCPSTLQLISASSARVLRDRLSGRWGLLQSLPKCTETIYKYYQNDKLTNLINDENNSLRLWVNPNYFSYYSFFLGFKTQIKIHVKFYKNHKSEFFCFNYSSQSLSINSLLAIKLRLIIQLVLFFGRFKNPSIIYLLLSKLLLPL